MSQVVTEMPRRAGGFPKKYPWELWFDGRIHLLEKGCDFTAPRKRFQQQVLIAARRRGATVTTRCRGDQLYIQATVQP